MQSVTAIISRKRCGGREQKKGKKRLYEGGKARTRIGLNSKRPFIASASGILCRGPLFFFLSFFYRVTRPVKTRHTSHISL